MSDYESIRVFRIGGGEHKFVFRCDNMHHPKFREWYVQWANNVNQFVSQLQANS